MAGAVNATPPICIRPDHVSGVEFTAQISNSVSAGDGKEWTIA
ncbi:MAG: hypothetical protein ACRDRG_07870 [Pseudonocardiaceae bacterium]